MALTPEQIQERIDTLEAGLAKIEAGTSFADRGVTYVTAESLLTRIAYFQGLLVTPTGRPRQTLITASKGF